MTRTSTVLPFRHVLCPVDFSEHSRAALRYGAALARRSRGRLTVLYINDPLLGAAAAAAAYDVGVLDAKTAAELRRFVARALGADHAPATLATAFGQAAPEIIKAADSLAADLVAMGSRGITGPGKWLFGSTTERVLRRTAVPVLVVPKPKQRSRARRASLLRSWPGKRVLVPVDLGDYVGADVRRALQSARSFGATPVLMHAVPPLQFPSWLRVDARNHERNRLAAARAELEKLGAAAGGKLEYQLVVGAAAEQIVASATKLGAGLIVLTIKNAAVPFGPRQGSIAYRVLSSEAAPILAIPSLSQ